MVRWGMVIDLRKCIGCATCKEVCERVNENPWGVWRRVIEHGTEGNPGHERLFLTMSCMHCSRPPCLEICPTGATYLRPDGIVDIKEYLCIGCGACILACPYRAREILMEDFMRPLGLSINALARALAVPANRVSGIVNGNRAISADTALRLGKYFGTSPEIWLDLQSDYELRIARQTTWTRVEPTVQTRVA